MISSHSGILFSDITYFNLQVQSCSESVDNLEQNNRYIMELVNNSCR